MGWLWRCGVGSRNQPQCVVVSESSRPSTGTLTSPEAVSIEVAPAFCARTVFWEPNGFPRAPTQLLLLYLSRDGCSVEVSISLRRSRPSGPNSQI